MQESRNAFFRRVALAERRANHGRFGTGFRHPGDFQAQASFLETLADHIAISYHNAQLHEQLQFYAAGLEQRVNEQRRSSARSLCASDHERRVIAYEIHDGLAQQLVAAIMHFQGYASLKEQQPAKGQAAYDTGMQMLQDANREARPLISGIRSPTLDESGLVVAIEYLVQDQTTRHGPTIAFHSDVRFERLDPVLENAVYRIAQEALANACVHSGSKKVDVSLVQEDDTVCLKNSRLGMRIRSRFRGRRTFWTGGHPGADQVARRAVVDR